MSEFKFNCQGLLRQSNKLAGTLIVSTPNKPDYYLSTSSDEFTLCGALSIRFKGEIVPENEWIYKTRYFIETSKSNAKDIVNYTLQVVSVELKLSTLIDGLSKPTLLKEITFDCRNNNIIQQIYNSSRLSGGGNFNRIDVDITMGILSEPKLDIYFEDTELTDCKLVGELGSISAHRLILANCSTVIKTMLNGSWKESKNGEIKIPASMKTLEHLKEYIYLDKMPDLDEDLERLLDLAHCYQMSDLIQKCCMKLLFNYTPARFMDLSILATKYKLKRLIYGMHNEAMDNSSIPDDWQ